MTERYVLVIGAAAIDTKGYTFAPLQRGTSNPGKIKSNSGGVARNIAENLVRLGEHAVLLSAVGTDRSGTRVINRLNEVGVDARYLITTPDYRTGSYIALYDQKKTLIHSLDDMGVMQAVTPQVVYRHRRLIREASMIVLDGNLSPETFASIIKQAQSNKIPVVADPTSTGLAERIKPHLSDFYMITPNAAEAEILTGKKVRSRQSGIEAAQSLVSLGVTIAVITLAEKGVVYATSDTSGHIPALTTNVVDLTGASDAMSAAIIFGLLNQFPIDEAVRLGAGAAALTLQSEETVLETLNLDQLYNV